MGQAGWKEHTKLHRKTTGSHGHGLKKVALKHQPSKGEVAAAVEAMCREARDAGLSCSFGSSGKKAKRPAVRALDLGVIARTLLTRIQLPDPRPLVGPDPGVNEWGMVAVGYPVWLWTAGPRVVVDRVRAFGVTFTLRATWVSSRFVMGDGGAVTCTDTKAYSKRVKPGVASPVCGYAYTTSSLPKGDYVVTATTRWRVSWSALGVSGSMPASVTGSRHLPVGELNALIVK